MADLTRVDNAEAEFESASVSTSNSHAEDDSTVTITEFTLFPQLPLELRFKIWHAASCAPRDLDIWTRRMGTLYGNLAPGFGGTDVSVKVSGHDYLFSFRSPSSVPSLLHVNQESRAEGLKFFKLSFGVSHTSGLISITSPPRIYLNPISDRVFFNIKTGHQALPTIIDNISQHQIRRFALLVFNQEQYRERQERRADNYIHMRTFIAMMPTWYHDNIEEFGCFRYSFEPKFGDKLKFVDNNDPKWQGHWKINLIEIMDAHGYLLLPENEKTKGVPHKVYRPLPIKLLTLVRAT